MFLSILFPVRKVNTPMKNRYFRVENMFCREKEKIKTETLAIATPTHQLCPEAVVETQNTYIQGKWQVQCEVMQCNTARPETHLLTLCRRE